MYTFTAHNNVKKNILKNYIPSEYKYKKVANFVCQPKGTADEYLLKCAINHIYQ